MKTSIFIILLVCTASSLAKEQTLTETKITSLINNVANDLQQLITDLITNLFTGIDIGKTDLLDTKMRSSVIGNIIKFIENFIYEFNKIKDILLPVIGVILRDLFGKLSK